MDKFFAGYSAGILSALIAVVIVARFPGSRLNLYDKAITQCEQSLPRDQNCKVVGVVDTLEVKR